MREECSSNLIGNTVGLLNFKERWFRQDIIDCREILTIRKDRTTASVYDIINIHDISIFEYSWANFVLS